MMTEEDIFEARINDLKAKIADRGILIDGKIPIVARMEFPKDLEAICRDDKRYFRLNWRFLTRSERREIDKRTAHLMRHPKRVV